MLEIFSNINEKGGRVAGRQNGGGSLHYSIVLDKLSTALKILPTLSVTVFAIYKFDT